MNRSSQCADVEEGGNTFEEHRSVFGSEISVKTIPAARTRIGAAAPAATMAKAAETREGSARPAKSTDGLKLSQTRGDGFTAKEKEPAAHAASGDMPEPPRCLTVADRVISLGVKDDAKSVRRCPPAGLHNTGVERNAITPHPADTGGEGTGICSHEGQTTISPFQRRQRAGTRARSKSSAVRQKCPIAQCLG
jgi:hypothetical protein